MPTVSKMKSHICALCPSIKAGVSKPGAVVYDFVLSKRMMKMLIKTFCVVTLIFKVSMAHVHGVHNSVSSV